MTKLEIAIAILAGIGLVGLIWLLKLGEDTTVLLPIVSALVAWILGKGESFERAWAKVRGKKFASKRK